ncbi:ubiquitin-like small modifier protein 1 [Spirillospora sp. CA-255316]
MNVTIRLPGALRDIAGARAAIPVEVPASATVGDALDALGRDLPAVGRRVRDERGALRPHVNVFLGATNIRDMAFLATPLSPGAEVYILPAVSGG